MHVVKQKFEFSMFSTPKAGQENQDTAFFDDEAFSFGVFDGVGGHQDGEVASRLAREAAIPVLGEPITNTADALQNIMTALQAGNSSVCKYNRDNGNNSGSTAILGQFVILDDESQKMELCLGWAGDCRGYLFRSSKLQHLGIDDAMTFGDLKFGDPEAGTEDQRKMLNQIQCSSWTSSVTDEQAEYFANRNFILTALGLNSQLEFVNGDPQVCCSVEPGDMLLFCSDGISDNLVDADIAKLLSSGDVEYAAQNMLRLGKQIASQPLEVNPRAKDDDMTALVIKV
jgi:serine/threonine protein phosphatase PrpC